MGSLPRAGTVGLAIDNALLCEALARACSAEALVGFRRVAGSFEELAAANLAELSAIVVSVPLGDSLSRYKAAVGVQQHWPGLPVIVLASGQPEHDVAQAIGDAWIHTEHAGGIPRVASIIRDAANGASNSDRVARETFDRVCQIVRHQGQRRVDWTASDRRIASSLEPPVNPRALARDWGVSLSTVHRTLRDLKAQLCLSPGEAILDDELYDRAILLGRVHVRWVAVECSECARWDTNRRLPVST